MALYGDTSGRLSGHQKGNDQTLTLDDHVGGTAYGDANQMLGTSKGSDDVQAALTGGVGATNYLYGDANKRQTEDEK